MSKWLYELKPVIMIVVAVLAFIQIKDSASLFEISGYVLLIAGMWILFARLKYRGHIKNKDKD